MLRDRWRPFVPFICGVLIRVIPGTSTSSFSEMRFSFLSKEDGLVTGFYFPKIHRMRFGRGKSKAVCVSPIFETIKSIFKITVSILEFTFGG